LLFWQRFVVGFEARVMLQIYGLKSGSLIFII
jgi:hypothetical protein